MLRIHPASIKTMGRKLPYRITLEDSGPFAFAGLWERWEKAPDCVPVESCTIVTTAANALVSKLHDRMPVILPADAYPAWLGEDSASPPELLALLKPYPADAMRTYPVRTVVNSPKNDTPECIEAVIKLAGFEPAHDRAEQVVVVASCTIGQEFVYLGDRQFGLPHGFPATGEDGEALAVLVN